MQPIYQAVIDDLDQRIARLQAAKAAVIEAGHIAEAPIAAAPARTSPGAVATHARLSGTDALIVSALKERPLSVADLVKDAKVEEVAVRRSLTRLRQGKRVAIVPKTWPRQFELTKR